MSRWTRRSAEDKARILREQHQMYMSGKNRKYEALLTKIDDANRLEIYRQHRIPMRCNVHGWVNPKNYALVNKIILTGECPYCGRELMRNIKKCSNAETDAVKYLIDELKKAGKIKSRRV